MKNLIHQWASLIDENYNPDDYANDMNDMESEKYEEQQKTLEEIQKQIAEINAKLDKNNINEADDDELPDGEDDEELKAIERKYKADDEKMAKQARDDAEWEERFKDLPSKRLERGEITQDEFNELVTKRDTKGQYNKTKYYVYFREFDMDFVEDSTVADTNEEGTMEFDTEEEAKAFANEVAKKMCQKYNITIKDFVRIDTKKEVQGGKDTYMANAIPHNVRVKDDDAMGFLYHQTIADGNKIGFDAQKKAFDMGKDKDSKLERITNVEFIIYKSKSGPASRISAAEKKREEDQMRAQYKELKKNRIELELAKAELDVKNIEDEMKKTFASKASIDKFADDIKKQYAKGDLENGENGEEDDGTQDDRRGRYKSKIRTDRSNYDSDSDDYETAQSMGNFDDYSYN